MNDYYSLMICQGIRILDGWAEQGVPDFQDLRCRCLGIVLTRARLGSPPAVPRVMNVHRYKFVNVADCGGLRPGRCNCSIAELCNCSIASRIGSAVLEVTGLTRA